MNKVSIRKSKVQGLGVFAVRDIQMGEVVITIDDNHVVTDPNTLSEYQNEYECDYLANGKVVLMQEPEKYINHSCDPNTYIKTIDRERKVIAMRAIKVGDEITYDYSINGYNDGTFKCQCKSEKCRGIYQGNFFKLPKADQLRYLPYLEEWFINEHELEIERLTQLLRKDKDEITSR